MSAPPLLPNGHQCSVSLSRAVLCEDCNEIAAPIHEACAMCGSGSILQLAKVLNRSKDSAPAHPVEIRISVGSEDWEFVQLKLEELSCEAAERTLQTFQMCGASGHGGSYAVTSVTRDVAAEQYRSKLQEWFQCQQEADNAVL